MGGGRKMDRLGGVCDELGEEREVGEGGKGRAYSGMVYGSLRGRR